MQIQDLSQYFASLEKEASRNKKIEIISELLKKLTKDEIAPAIYLFDGRVVPRYHPLEFNLSTKMVLRALQRAFGVEALESRYKELGDAGLLAEELAKGKKSEKLSILEVFKKLLEIANMSGKGSQESKILELSTLMKNLDELSIKYVSRIIIGQLRMGLNDKTILDAISWTLAGDKSLRDTIERAYGVRSDLGEVTTIALTKGVKELEDLKVEVGIPVSSKLVEREKDVSKIYERMENFIIQPKYDGLRAQIHFKRSGIDILSDDINDQKIIDNSIKLKAQIYSRNMENMTLMFPKVTQDLEKFNFESVVFDSEVIGYDEVKKKFIPFQETSQRRRKHGVEEKEKQFPVKVFVFDILFLNGVDVTTEPLSKRLETLKKIFKENKVSGFELTESIEINDEKVFREKFLEYINSGLEGLIAKDLATIYKPGTRNYDWIKLKASAEAGFTDTVDAVVMGYFKGRGVRAKFGIGALLMGLYDKKSDTYQSVAKLGTGIKDEQWPPIKELLDGNISNEKPGSYVVDKLLEPDVWVHPKVVLEVEADEITLSKNHTAGRTGERGYSLRFPRLKKIREKGPEQSTGVDEIKKMFELNKH